ncbi:hypothetical protein FRC11_009059, partial [Ceratobasidium sp. 423]
YFIAPLESGQGAPELAVFSVSRGDRMVSLVDESSPFYYLDQSLDTVIYFTIGDLQYQWDTVRNTLLSRQVGTGPSVSELDWFDVPLYTNPEEARALADWPLFDGSSLVNLGHGVSSCPLP